MYLLPPTSSQLPFSWPPPSSSSPLSPLETPPPIDTPRGPGGDHPDDNPNDLQNWSSLIGIVTAIVGNILIALALNVQRYAHIRIHRRRLQVRDRARQAMKNAANGGPLHRPEDEPGRVSGHGTYGATAATPATSRESPLRSSSSDAGSDSDDDQDAHESDPLARSFQSADSRWSEDGDGNKVVSSYLKDPYWWLGQVLITVGEMGNFLAYGFAPASIVSPLGVVALVSNCVIAPILFKEVFRPRDFWGVLVAIAGAVTVVLSAKQRETKLAPHDVWDAITTVEFEVYLGLTWGLIIFLMWASPRYGSRTIVIDLGLVGLFGGYTALSTKGVSSMLSSTLFKAFTNTVTYVLILILLSTAVMQVRYLNKALQRFDSTQVIPTQFVLFTLSVIIGSAVLYRDFERTTGQQAAKFVGGCLLTFFGVFLITSGRPRNGDADAMSDAEGVEETIGLAEHTATAAAQPSPRVPAPPHHSSKDGGRDAGSAVNSRRSSRASHATLAESLGRTPRTAASDSRASPAEEDASSPLHDNPWQDSPLGREQQPRQQYDYDYHPGIGSHTISAESVLTVHTAPPDAVSPGTPPQHTHTYPTPSAAAAGPHPDQSAAPATPQRASMSSSRPRSKVLDGPVISPSPFASTVTAVVADKILPRNMRRIVSQRVAARRPGIQSAMFAPHDGVDDDEADVEGPAAASPSRRAGRRAGGGDLSGDDDDDELWPGDDQQAPPGSFRGRARSLSNALGDILGVKKKSKGQKGTTTRGAGESFDGEGQSDPLLAPATRPLGSTETL